MLNDTGPSETVFLRDDDALSEITSSLNLPITISIISADYKVLPTHVHKPYYKPQYNIIVHLNLQ